MPMNAKPCPLPADSLLLSYQANGDFVDCYKTQIAGTVTLAQFISAFYTTPLFKLERFILQSMINKPSTDDQVRQLANSEVTAFAAWTVEVRNDEQLLMCDFQKKTRSWFMLKRNDVADNTDLYFGSAVVARVDPRSGKSSMGSGFKALLGFHTLYSKLLLNAARKHLNQSQNGGLNQL